MSVPSKWANRRETPKFAERVGLAQPVLAAGALTFFTALLGLPILYLLNQAFGPNLAPAGVMDTYALGQIYTTIAGSLAGPLEQLIEPEGGLTLGGILTCAFAVSLFAWAIAMMLIAQRQKLSNIFRIMMEYLVD